MVDGLDILFDVIRLEQKNNGSISNRTEFYCIYYYVMLRNLEQKLKEEIIRV